MIIIELLTREKEDDYENFVMSQKESMFYYSLRYRNLIEATTSGMSEYYIASCNGKIVGVLPLMTKTGSYGEVVNSLPYYGSHGGILCVENNVKQALIEFYNTRISRPNVISATLIENPLGSNDLYRQIKSNENDSRIGQFTHIKGTYNNLEELMVNFHSKTRNSVRKPIKSNVSISVDNNSLAFLYATHVENMQSIGGMPKSKLFFDLISTKCRPGIDYNIYIATFEKQVISALLLFYYNKTVEYFTPVTVKEFRHLQPLSLLITHAMFDAATQGYEWWNYGGTWKTQKGVYDFKSGWGTQDISYNYHVYIADPKLYFAKKDVLLQEYAGFYVVPFDKLSS